MMSYSSANDYTGATWEEGTGQSSGIFLTTEIFFKYIVESKTWNKSEQSFPVTQDTCLTPRHMPETDEKHMSTQKSAYPIHTSTIPKGQKVEVS